MVKDSDPAWKVYEEELERSGKGLPRWFPEPLSDTRQVKIGDVVTVTYGSGRTVKFKITKSEPASKKGVPQDDSIWDWDNPEPVLRLITCDPETPINQGHYEGNWVVWADQMVS